MRDNYHLFFLGIKISDSQRYIKIRSLPDVCVQHDMGELTHGPWHVTHGTPWYTGVICSDILDPTRQFFFNRWLEIYSLVMVVRQLSISIDYWGIADNDTDDVEPKRDIINKVRFDESEHLFSTQSMDDIFVGCRRFHSKTRFTETILITIED